MFFVCWLVGAGCRTENKLVRHAQGIEESPWRSLFEACSASLSDDGAFDIPKMLERQPKLATRFGWAEMQAGVEADPSIAIDAGRVDFDLAAGRGWTHMGVKAGWPGVQEALRDGTVVFNQAGLGFPELADACRACVDVFEMPVGVNVYLSPAGLAMSAPAHSDKQDVFVVHLAGAKKWTVYEPPHLTFDHDPYARGKGADVLSADDLRSVALERTLEPGDVLFVPAGAPHQTATLDDKSSLHLTFGLVTRSTWGLSYDTLRALTAPNLSNGRDVCLRPHLHAALQRTLPLGAFFDNQDSIEAEFRKIPFADTELEKMTLVLPDKDSLTLAAQRLRRHHSDILVSMRTAYDHTQWRGSYIDRVDPLTDIIGDLIDALYAPPKAKTTTRVPAAATIPPPRTRSAPKNKAIAGKQRGFGGGGGGGAKRRGAKRK